MAETTTPSPTPTIEEQVEGFLKPPQLPPVEVTEKQKEAFYKAFLANEPYKEEFNLFNGRRTIVFRTMTSSDSTDLLTQMEHDRTKANVDASAEYRINTLGKYRLVLSLDSIDGVPFLADITKKTNPFDRSSGTSFITKRVEHMSDWPLPVLAAYYETLATFDRTVEILTKKATDPDFWKAAV